MHSSVSFSLLSNASLFVVPSVSYASLKIALWPGHARSSPLPIFSLFPLTGSLSLSLSLLQGGAVQCGYWYRSSSLLLGLFVFFNFPSFAEYVHKGASGYRHFRHCYWGCSCSFTFSLLQDMCTKKRAGIGIFVIAIGIVHVL